jgi:predicted amidophosphoribosyltransferase
VEPSQAPKCSRCWTHNTQVDPETELCPRCAQVLKKITL